MGQYEFVINLELHVNIVYIGIKFHVKCKGSDAKLSEIHQKV
jgi:hypothetical protein